MKRLRYSIILALLAVFLLATPAYADTPDPDSTPTVDEINIYTNVLETGDWLIVIYANIPYAIPPTTPVTSTFIWRFMDTDNVTELANTVGTNYNDDGYGYNVYSMYLTADNRTPLPGIGMVGAAEQIHKPCLEYLGKTPARAADRSNCLRTALLFGLAQLLSHLIQCQIP